MIGESMLLRESLERRLGFDLVLQEQFPRLTALQTIETHGRAAELRDGLRATLAHPGWCAGSTCWVRGTAPCPRRWRPLAGRGAGEPRSGHRDGHELTPHAPRRAGGGNDGCRHHPEPGHVVRSALRVLRAISTAPSSTKRRNRIRIEIVMRENMPALAVAD